MNEEASTGGALVAAFIKAQSEMSAVIKGAVNPAFKSRYADLAAVIDAVLPALNKNGIGLVQSPRFDGETVTVDTVLMHAGGGTIKNELAMRPTKNDPQGVGSAITYARRYALLAICGVAPEDDDGNAASVPQARPEPKRAEPQKPTLADRADRLEATLKSVKTAAELRKAYDLGSGLCAELDAHDPDRLAEINAIYETRFAELSTKVPA